MCTLKTKFPASRKNETLTLPTVGMNSKRNRKQKSPLELSSRGLTHYKRAT